VLARPSVLVFSIKNKIGFREAFQRNSYEEH